MKSLKLRSPLTNISVYVSKGLIVLYGYDPCSGMYRVLEISRPVLSTDGNLKVKQLPQEFTAAQADARKANMKTAYKDMELLHNNVVCVYGCIKLLDSFYVVLVTKAIKCGSLAGHSIYTVEETAMIPVTFGVRSNPEETRYRAVLTGFDLTKHIYFSFSYDLTKSWQANASVKSVNEQGVAIERVSCQSMFVWNSFALKPLLRFADATDSMDKWCLPMIYGYVHQRNMRLAGGVSLKFILIARRSRHFAGTRYLRRGVDTLGNVANEVESEQIFIRTLPVPGDVPRVTSVVQCRGSIPLFWSHTNLYAPKPDVQLESNELVRQRSAQHHFENLFVRYGFNVNVLNLVKQANSQGELMLGTAFRETCEVLNSVFQSKAREMLCALAVVRPDIGLEDTPKFLVDPTSTESTTEYTALTDDPISPPLRYIAYDFLNMAKLQHAAAASSEGVATVGYEVPNVFRDLNRICEKIFPTIGFYVDPPDTCFNSIGRGDASETEGASHLRFPYSSVCAGFEERCLDLGDLEALLKEPTLEDDMCLMQTNGETGYGIPVGLKQDGVLRTNCMDCLDRTNVAQFCFARVAIPRQLRSLGINLTTNGLQEVISLCMEVWAEHGDTIAIQYGGSGAMHKVDEQESSGTGEKEFVLTGGAKNAVVAVRRYYSNISTDFERQDSIDVLLGIFEPKKNQPPIWEQRLRTENMREGVRGRRVSDMHEANARNERLAAELQLLAKSNSMGRTQQSYELEGVGDGSESEEDRVSRTKSADSYNGQSSQIAGFKVLGAAGSHFHESFSHIELTNFYDIVEDFHVDNVKMDQIRVYPFPLVAHNDGFRRYGLLKTASHSDNERHNSKVSAASTAIEQLYDSYIDGDFMFSTCVVDYDVMLKRRAQTREPSEMAATVAKEQQPPPLPRTNGSEDRSSIECGIVNYPDAGRPASVAVMQSTNQSGSGERQSVSSDTEVKTQSKEDSRSQSTVSQNGPPQNSPAPKKGGFLWPFRRSSVGETERGSTSAATTSTEQSLQRDGGERLGNGRVSESGGSIETVQTSSDVADVVKRLDEVSRKIDLLVEGKR